ncbi:MAG: hypothetical protein JWN04_6216 [Myxococcaceae bacterium]|nr:hypothetical protein [Myxococcaceae bacterium]
MSLLSPRIRALLTGRPLLALSDDEVRPGPLLASPSPAWLRLIVCTGALLLVQWPSAPSSHIDLLPTYLAAHLAGDGQWQDVYPLPTPEGSAAHGVTWHAEARELGLNAGGTGPFTYHPYYLRAAVPLAQKYSFDDFKRYSIRVSRVCIAWIAFEIAALLGVTSLAGQLLLTLLLGASSPMLSSLELGQNTPLALALLMAALRLWARGSGRLSLLVGVLLYACAWAAKPWCALALPLCFVFRAPLAASAATSAVLGIMVALPFALFPRVLLTHYLALTEQLSSITVHGFLNLSVLVSLERVMDPGWAAGWGDFGQGHPTPRQHYVALAIAAAVALAAAAALYVRRPPRAWTTAAALALVLVPLSVAWTHYFAFALPLAIMASAADHDSRILRAAGLGLLAQLVVLEFWLAWKFERESAWPMVVPMASVIAVALLALWLGHRRENAARAPT